MLFPSLRKRQRRKQSSRRLNGPTAINHPDMRFRSWPAAPAPRWLNSMKIFGLVAIAMGANARPARPEAAEYAPAAAGPNSTSGAAAIGSDEILPLHPTP